MGQIQKLNAAFKAGDRKVICAAIFAEIHGTGNVSAFALKAGMSRPALYRAFQRNNVRFDTVLKVVRAADYKLAVSGHRGLHVAFKAEEIRRIVTALDDALRSLHLERVSPLYRIIRPPYVPRFDAVLSTLNALGLHLEVIPRKH
jgi:probable addiction module antidote protein